MFQNSTMLNNEPIYRILAHILDSVEVDGSWGGTDFEDWGPIITVLTVDLLLSLGFTPDTEWHVNRGGIGYSCTLNRSIEYLDNSIGSDGSFGEDFWDLCKIGLFLNKYNLKDRITNYDKLEAKIAQSIQNCVYRQRDMTWSGPAFYSIVIDYLDQIGNASKANDIFNELMMCQSQDGSFRGALGSDGSEFVHPVWHASQVLLTFLRRNISEKDQKITSLVEWIKNAQDSSGCYKAFSRYSVYYTAYAILGLTALSNPPRQTIKRSVLWLVNNISASGKVADSGGTIMAALALKAASPLNGNLSTSILEMRKIDYLEAVNKCLFENVEQTNIEKERIENENLIIKEELKRYKEKYDDADIVLTKPEVFKFGIYITVLLFGLGVILPIFTSWVISSKKSSQIPVVIQIDKSQIQDSELPTEEKK